MTTKTEKQAVTDYMKTGMRVPPGEPNTGELLGSAHAVTNQWPAGFKFLAVIDLRGWFVEVKRHGQMVAYSNPNPEAEAVLQHLATSGFALAVWSCNIRSGEMIRFFPGLRKSFVFVWGGDRCTDRHPERSPEAPGKPLLLKPMAQIQEVYGNELAGRPVLMLENDWTKCLENTEAAGACLITPTYRHAQTPETAALALADTRKEATSLTRCIDAYAMAADSAGRARMLADWGSANPAYRAQMAASDVQLTYAFSPARPLELATFSKYFMENAALALVQPLEADDGEILEDDPLVTQLAGKLGAPAAVSLLVANAIIMVDLDIDHVKLQAGVAKTVAVNTLGPFLKEGLVGRRDAARLALEQASVKDVLVELKQARLPGFDRLHACTWEAGDAALHANALTAGNVAASLRPLLTYQSEFACEILSCGDEHVLVCMTATGRLWAAHLLVGAGGMEVSVDLLRYEAAFMAVQPMSARLVDWLSLGLTGQETEGWYTAVVLTKFPAAHSCGQGGQHLQPLQVSEAGVLQPGSRLDNSAQTVALRETFEQAEKTLAVRVSDPGAEERKRLVELRDGLLPGEAQSWVSHLAETFVQNGALSADIARSGYQIPSDTCGLEDEGDDAVDLSTLAPWLAESDASADPDSVFHNRTPTRDLVITIQGDYKQNPKCVDQWKRSQGGYFAAPTCAYHGFVIYLPNSAEFVINTDAVDQSGNHFCDHYSNDKEKNTCWLMHAFEMMVTQHAALFSRARHLHFWDDNGMEPYHCTIISCH